MTRALAVLLALSACGDDSAQPADGNPDGPPGPDGRNDATPLPDIPEAACGRDTPITALTAGVSTTGTTVAGENHAEGTCGGMTGADAFHTIDVFERADLIVTTDLPGTQYNAVVYVRSVCSEPTSELGCASTGPLGDTLVVRDIQPGTYFVILDGQAGAQGAYEVQVTIRPVRDTGEGCDPTGAADRCEEGTECLDEGSGPTCLDPFTLACMDGTAATAGTVLTGTIPTTDLLAPACASGGGEAIYALDLASPGFIHAVEQGTGLGAGSTLYARGPASCNPQDDLACDTTTGGLGILTGPLEAGRYYVVIDGSGDYQVALDVGTNLTVDAACDPASTTARCGVGLYCLSATCQSVTFVEDVSPNAAFCDAQGPFTGNFVVDAQLTSGGATDVDTFEVQLASAGVLHIETTDGFTGCAVNTVVEVFSKGGSSCGALDAGSPTPIASDDDSGVDTCSLLTTASLSPGTYYVRVRRGGSGAGPYTLLVDVP